MKIFLQVLCLIFVVGCASRKPLHLTPECNPPEGNSLKFQTMFQSPKGHRWVEADCDMSLHACTAKVITVNDKMEFQKESAERFQVIPLKERGQISIFNKNYSIKIHSEDERLTLQDKSEGRYPATYVGFCPAE